MTALEQAQKDLAAAQEENAQLRAELTQLRSEAGTWATQLNNERAAAERAALAASEALAERDKRIAALVQEVENQQQRALAAAKGAV